MRQPDAISLEGISCRRGKVDVLRGVTLSVAPGQLVVIAGSNGSGKSTLLRVLAGLERPSGGRGEVGGHDLLRDSVGVRGATGYVPELPAFEPELSVYEELTLHARLAKLGAAEARATVASMLELLELTGLRNRAPATLSRGQLQRLAIGRALVHDPAILLLDEPLIALDEVGQAELTEVIEELRQLGKTVVMASRVPGPLLGIADSAYTLLDGVLAAPPTAEPAGSVRLRLAVLGDGERVLTWLSEREDVLDARLDDETAGGPARLSVALRSPDEAAIARVVRAIVERGAAVVEVYSASEVAPV